MGDHFVLLVDRLLTESTLGAAIESRNLLLKQAAPVTIDEAIIDCGTHKNSEASLSPRKLVECRICQDEDMDSNMESPCSCSGSLKYAHRKCVQRWCNEKGDTICEICHQQFKPGYTAPPPIFRFGGLPVNLRGNWQIARRDLNNPRIIAMVSTDHTLLDSGYDEYDVSTSRSIVCCRSIAIIVSISLSLSYLSIYYIHIYIYTHI
ncbi:E3 ubiquitin-protein ligase march2 [Phtheirospermum japonicum]|uniref:E3 ubiquitin-protein ligase march2 n=1 Tax=Phtheirospermum japonicum TaxID=374723 RepID=A0A830BI00_9LAMI|nr:E3 ubiquitin-protein ligase march2 [Phtheirospermum japonicum]